MIYETINNWYQRPAPEVLSQLSVDPEQGLTRAEVDRRQQEYDQNALTKGKGESPFKLFIEQFKDPMIYILIVALLLIWSVYLVFERALLRFDDMAVAQTAAVNAIVFGEIFFLINVRSFRHKLSEIGFFSNKRLLGSVMIMIVLQLLFTHAGFMNRNFGTAPLGMGAWLYIITISFIIFLAVEFMKWYDRRQAMKRSGKLTFGAAVAAPLLAPKEEYLKGIMKNRPHFTWTPQ